MSGKIVVFGSCNLDLFLPVPALDFFCATGPGAEDGLHTQTYSQAAGGKGANQAVAAARAGGKVYFFSAVGQGGEARGMIDHLKAMGVHVKGVAQTSQPTGMAVIFIKPDGSHKMVVSHAANMLAKAKQIPDSMLNKNTVVLVQAETDLKENAALLRRARQKGARTVYNVAPAVPLSEKELKLVDDLIVNEAEAHVIAGHIGIKAASIQDTARAIAKRFKLTCIVTRGADGVLCATPDGAVMGLPALPVRVVDSVGAGDAFAGAYVAALSHGHPQTEALAHGIVAGGLACTRLGAQTALPTAAEIARRLPALRKLIKK